LLNFFEFEPLFRIHYREDFVRDANILVLKRRGILVKKMLSLFNSKLGSVLLAASLKITRSFLFTRLLAYNPNNYPNPDMKSIIKNFEKVSEK